MRCGMEFSSSSSNPHTHTHTHKKHNTIDCRGELSHAAAYIYTYAKVK